MTEIQTQDNQWRLELHECLCSLDEVIDYLGEEKTSELIKTLRNHALRRGVKLVGEALNTPYINTINVKEQLKYPGDTEIELKLENITRWNEMCVVLQAYDSGEGLGRHIAIYASAATMDEVGYNHFFKKKSAEYGGDLVSFQPHAAPGIYATSDEQKSQVS